MIKNYKNKKDKCNKKITDINNIINTNKENIDKLKNNIEKFKNLYEHAKNYFEGSPYYKKNKAKAYLYELLNYVIQLVIGNNISLYIKNIITNNYNVSNNKVEAIDNIFKSYKILNDYSLTKYIMAQSKDMIKSNIGLFADEVDEENYEIKTVSSIIETTINTFIEQRNSDENDILYIDNDIITILNESKGILSEYFESFVSKYINNLVSVYENNMKFVINHYRLYNMYLKSIN